jgi:hypothetical protein
MWAFSSGVEMRLTNGRAANLSARTALVLAIAAFGLGSGLGASDGRFATLEERIGGAERVVVATARNVTPEWRENQYGDRLIVSRVQLEIAETLKGTGTETVWLDVEGGTLDGFTLRVSSLPLIQRGERAVFFLDAASRGVYTPYLRGQGILKLDENNIVRGTNLRLDEIRTRARAQARQGGR